MLKCFFYAEVILKKLSFKRKKHEKKTKNNSCIPDNKMELQIPGKYEL